MPIDASIYSQLGQGVTPIMNPLDIQGKRAQLQQIALQNERTSLENQAMRDRVAEDADTKAALAETGGDLAKAQAVLVKRGNLKAAKMMADTRIAQAKSDAELQDALTKMDKFTQERVGQWNENIARRAYNVKQLPQEQRAGAWLKNIEETIQGLQPDPNDPPQIAAMKMSQGKGLLSEYQKIQADPSSLDTRLDEHLNNSRKLDQLLANPKVTGWHEGVDTATGKPAVFGIKEGVGPVKYEGVKPAAKAPLVQVGGVSVPRKVDESGNDAGPDLSALPKGQAALIKMLGEYRVSPAQALPRGKERTAIMETLAQAYPGWNIADAEANHKFVKDLASGAANSAGGTIAAAERLLGHSGEAIKLSDTIGDSKFGKIGNLISGEIDRTTGTGKAGEIKAFELSKGKIIAELNKLANGGVPHADEMARDVEQLQYHDPKKVKEKVLKAAIDLGLEQVHAIEAKRANILGPNDPGTSLLSDRAQKVVKDVFKRTGDKEPELQPASGSGYTKTAISNNPQKQAGPKIGSIVDGYVFKGGNPADPNSWKKVK